MPALATESKFRADVADPWAAHNASSHIPNDETARVIEDALAGRDLFGTFATAEEAVRAMCC